MKVDPETDKIVTKNRHLLDMVKGDGWKIARQMFVDKILELQNVAEYMDVIQTGNATKLLREMKAQKRAAEILFDFLRQVEGGAETAEIDGKPKLPSYIYIANNEKVED